MLSVSTKFIMLSVVMLSVVPTSDNNKNVFSVVVGLISRCLFFHRCQIFHLDFATSLTFRAKWQSGKKQVDKRS